MIHIEKSGFKRGEYVGYAMGVQWRIFKPAGYSTTFWRATATDAKGMYLQFEGRTLSEMDKRLAELEPQAPRESGFIKRNPAPRRGPAKPKRASQRAHVTKSGIESKTPTKRLVKRRTANTKKGYFPNPKERMFNVWHTDGTVTPVPLIARFSFYVAGKIRYWFALHDSPGQYNMYAVSEWESGVAVVTYSKSARIAYALSSRSLKTDSQLSTAKQELENRLAPVSLEKFQSAVKKAIENHGAIN